MRSMCLFLFVILTATMSPAAEAILVADFEGETYGEWKAEGEAFGTGPAKGTLRGQMHVSGFKGKGLVNSFLKGDRTTGTLISPPIKIERNYLTFLVGGGGHAGKTCMNLLVDGKIVHTITGNNSQPGGSEELEPAFWNVSELVGKTVTLQIVDAATGGWGHINVDHIVQTDTKPNLSELSRPRI
jgi:fructan beta-fructosidase